MANMAENRRKNQKADRSSEAAGTEHAVFDQHKFLEILKSLVERAKKKKNMLEYLEIHNVDVLRISDGDDDDDILLDDDDDVEVENIDLTVPDGVSIEDPVRMYLKEIGKVPLLSAEEEIDLAQKMENGVLAHEKIMILRGRKEKTDDPDEIADLNAEIRRLSLEQDRGEDAKKRLAEANLRLVVSIAKRYVGRGMLFLDQTGDYQGNCRSGPHDPDSGAYG